MDGRPLVVFTVTDCDPSGRQTFERPAVIKFNTDWVEATKILIARKRYLDDEEEES
jgi:hypothetical protein